MASSACRPRRRVDAAERGEHWALEEVYLRSKHTREKFLRAPGTKASMKREEMAVACFGVQQRSRSTSMPIERRRWTQSNARVAQRLRGSDEASCAPSGRPMLQRPPDAQAALTDYGPPRARTCTTSAMPPVRGQTPCSSHFWRAYLQPRDQAPRSELMLIRSAVGRSCAALVWIKPPFDLRL